MRLFIAVHFSDEIKENLLRAIESLRSQSLSGNFTRPQNLHLTLAFIGETGNVSAVRQILNAVPAAPFDLTVEGSGRFGDLWWAGIEGNPALEKLAREFQQNLRQAGFPIESLAFKPHITLGRRIVPKEEIALLVPRSAMTVTKISLMKSERLNGRLTYTSLCDRLL